MKNKKNAFTLIELIAVLVILAILALIVTPLVLNIVRNAKDSANKRSVDAYGKAVELSIATYLLDTGDFPTSINDLEVEYTGSEVICGIQQLNEDSSVYLSECTVGGTKVKDSNTDDGWYHYGKISTTVYQSYKIGDQITYNGMNFYVIADSDETQDSVTVLKVDPLTVDEVNIYGVGHVNKYTYESVGTAYNQDGYGGMAYYSSETCGYPTAGSRSSKITGCTTDYAQSEVKYVVDAWASDKFKTNELIEDDTGYSARMLTHSDLINNLGYIDSLNTSKTTPSSNGDTPSWVYNSNYWYWTMSPYEDSNVNVWYVYYNGNLGVGGDIYANYYGDGGGSIFGNYGVVRPVVTLLKSAKK